MAIVERKIVTIPRKESDGCRRGDNNNYYSIPTSGNTMTGPRNRANCRSSRRPAYTRSLIASRSWKWKNSLGTASGSLPRTIHRATIKSKLVRPYGGKGVAKEEIDRVASVQEGVGQPDRNVAGAREKATSPDSQWNRWNQCACCQFIPTGQSC